MNKRTTFAAGRYMDGRLYVRTAGGNYVALALLIGGDRDESRR